MLLADVELSTKLTALGAVDGKGRKEVMEEACRWI